MAEDSPASAQHPSRKESGRGQPGTRSGSAPQGKWQGTAQHQFHTDPQRAEMGQEVVLSDTTTPARVVPAQSR